MNVKIKPDTSKVSGSLFPAEKNQERIDFLDGFRGVAILLVLFYHYYSRYATDPQGMYPFGDLWSGFPLWQYGYYGVQLFFAVSGFVIALTLMRCGTFTEFTVRRFARLWPTMLLCACLSYAFLSSFPVYWPQHAANFLPSLTFIDGMQYQRFFPDIKFAWIDGGYWSLFVEVRFYAIAAVIYFIDKKRFLEHFWVFSLTNFIAYLALEVMHQSRALAILSDLLIPAYLPWFLLGIAAHCLWQGKRRWAAVFTATAFLPLLVSMAYSQAWHDVAVALMVCALFLLCFSSAAVRQFFSAGWLTAIGVSSYSLYLLHQNIGVTLTSLLAKHWSLSSRLSLGLPIFIGLGLIAVARLVYGYWETPLNSWIVQRFKRAVAVDATRVDVSVVEPAQ